MKTLCEIFMAERDKNPAAVALGSIRSARKSASSRRNGRKGGRPKAKKTEAKQKGKR